MKLLKLISLLKEIIVLHGTQITTMFKKVFLTVVSIQLLLADISAQQNPFRYSQKKNITVSQAAVVSAHPIASEAGIQILREGGNAIDAAIATQLALAVVYPAAGNLGGGGFLVAGLANGEKITIDYRETAPGKAYKEMYLDKNGDPIKELSMQKQLASGIPGTVAGIFESLKYARFGIKKLIAPAIVLAEKGFAITSSQAESFNSLRETFIMANTTNIAFIKKNAWVAGDKLVQTELAATLKRIRDKGQKGFYEGTTARLIVEEMKRGNGVISYEDLKKYKAVRRAPMLFDYKGHSIVTMSLPSSGGILLQQMMGMIEKRNISALKFQSAESVQLMVEAARRAFADRAQFLGDPDFIKVPVKQMVAEDYLQQRMNDFVPGKAGSSEKTRAGNIKESEETTHISIIDKEGNTVSVTTTLNNSYGSKTVVGGAGFLLNNEMDDFSVKEGAPNMYGAVGSYANAIAPYKRMLSSMTPVIIFKDNKPCMVVGTPGGTTIPVNVFQTIINVIEFNLSPQEAVNSAKFHHQWLPDIVYFEKNFPAAVINKMEAMGYKTSIRSPIGRVELLLIDPVTKKITAVADGRGDDSAAGY